MRRNRWLLGLFFLALSFCMPTMCAASENCPWLNAATAAGVLNGPVTFTVARHGEAESDATCEFTHHEGAVLSSLRIEVDTMKDPSRDFASYRAKCVKDAAPLRAIGNEAEACTVTVKKQFSEQIVSRVRERAFIVRMSSNTVAPEGQLRDKAEKIAEQVAGFLF